ncbi:hypothetical protein HH212_21525 [Massilia forsythiae]|uniref:Uncharacterized protein n=1 Tax=Massilia forsythiae TaxID=2728020 RepID=A0A7Z2W022_9BURK|nr:hypothetical protein [Massilia forsythiae]QJE02283.1 hypothetical protein HH212_21525 [Massilia forsythiae]
MTTKNPAFAPFENEADVLEIGRLMLENRLDRVTVSGDVDLTADRQGLEAARRLHALLGQVVARLEARKDLPDQLPPPTGETVANPFA